MTLDEQVAEITARFPDDPQARDAAIAGAVDNWLSHETTRPKERA